jgi:uncharacterized protein
MDPVILLVKRAGNIIYQMWTISQPLLHFSQHRNQLYTITSFRKNKKPAKAETARKVWWHFHCTRASSQHRGNMKLLVISDSHGNYVHALKAHQLAGPVDHIIHLGDGAEDARLMEQVLEVRVHRVAGNCDFDQEIPRELTLEFGDCRVFLTHGNRHLVKSGLGQLIRKGVEVGAQVVLYGHTHQPAVASDQGMLLVNPGALKEGFPGSYAIVTVEGAQARAEIFGL